MSIQASTLFDEFRQSGLLQEMTGDDVVIEQVSAVQQCGAGDLVFVDREAFVQPAIDGVEMLSPEDIAARVVALIRDPNSAGEVVSVENSPRVRED